MISYEAISDDWFFRRLPVGVSFDEYEAEAGVEDRDLTREVFAKLRRGFGDTLRQNFNIEPLPLSLDGIVSLDRLVTQEVVRRCLEASDPSDPNNYFKLTVSEIAVFLGEAWLRAFGGEWHYARMPNYADSYVELAGLKALVFDMAMKKCSDDFGRESPAEKWKTFATLAKGRSPGAIN
jgi:hypothetical protein